MDASSLFSSLDLVCGNGLSLSSEQRAALETSMIILKTHYRFNRVLLWGKILGIKHDYFIAQGVGEDEMKDKKCLYSMNCTDWHLLPQVTEAMVANVAAVARGRFLGDPSHLYDPAEIRRQGGGDAAVGENVMMKVSEENRLAATVFTIDKEVAVVPRGAYVRSPHGNVQTNRSFQGLNPTEAAKLNNYMHFSEAKTLKEKSILEMADLNPAIDFLDVLSDDVPKGSWSLQFEHGSRVCVIRSLLWFGLTFYHVPGTSKHGYIYMGDGLKTLDLPFML
ncbi:radial spoke head protein 9-like [Silurus asotus]|uniref:Radial spoke head protein 9 homolog n=1 Tax=Silurus asotus TaxID=30991 RepID=A0AAD5FBV6_SILAS|nr:radial spoke head protein 9-like [Silurus asotus]